VSVTDVELDRVLNALSTTFNDQHPDELDLARIQEIADGALGGEHKLQPRADGPWRAALHEAGGGRKLATLERSDAGRWSTSREQEAQGSHVAVPS
jgi:hypothetical protein